MADKLELLTVVKINQKWPRNGTATFDDITAEEEQQLIELGLLLNTDAPEPPTGTITVRSISDSGSTYTGVGVTLYDDTGENIIRNEIRTTSSGAVFEDVPTGDYIVRITYTTASVVVDQYDYMVTLTEDGAEVTVRVHRVGTVNVLTTLDGTAYPDLIYTVTLQSSSGEVIGTQQTNSSGNASFGGVRYASRYKITASDFNDNVEIESATQTFNVTSSVTNRTFAFTTISRNENISIKVLDDLGYPQQNIGVSIHNADKTEFYNNGRTNADGELTLLAPIGTITVSVPTVTVFFQNPPEDIVIDHTSANDLVNFELVRKRGQLLIRSRTDGGLPLAGAGFTLYGTGNREGELIYPEIISTTQGSNFGSIPAFTYRVVATTIPDGYTPDYPYIDVSHYTNATTTNYVFSEAAEQDGNGLNTLRNQTLRDAMSPAFSTDVYNYTMDAWHLPTINIVGGGDSDATYTFTLDGNPIPSEDIQIASSNNQFNVAVRGLVGGTSHMFVIVVTDSVGERQYDITINTEEDNPVLPEGYQDGIIGGKVRLAGDYTNIETGTVTSSFESLFANDNTYDRLKYDCVIPDSAGVNNTAWTAFVWYGTSTHYRYAVRAYNTTNTTISTWLRLDTTDLGNGFYKYTGAWQIQSGGYITVVCSNAQVPGVHVYGMCDLTIHYGDTT